MSYDARIFWLIIGIIVAGIGGFYLFPLRIYFYVLGFAFLIAGITFFVKYHKLWPTLVEEKYHLLEKKKVEPTTEFSERWQPIRQTMRGKDLPELRVAIIDADTLVEELLRAQGIEGDTMAALIAEATLKGISGTDILSRFHQLRNRIVHEVAFTPPVEQCQRALVMVDEVLVRWGVLLPPEA